jgi:hypothetical protein
MASTYSGNLAIELIGTGDQAGTWGNTTNTNLGTALEQSIVGSANVTMTSAANTAITIAQNNTFQAARSLRLNLVGTISTTPYLYVPAISKQYIVNNGLANTVIISNGANTGATGTTVSIPANKTVIIYNDGTNIAEATNYVSNLSLGTTLALTSGGTGANSAPAAMANLMGFTTTATANSNTTLDSTSSYYQIFTGTANQNVALPIVSTLSNGWTFHICNNSTGSLSIRSSGANTVITVPSQVTVMCTCISTSGTTEASWEAGLTDFSTATGNGSVVLATNASLSNVTILSGTANISNVTISAGTSNAMTMSNGTYTNYTESVVAIGTVTTTNTLGLSNGTVQTATLTASTACTFTMPTAVAGKSFVLLLKQAATTGAGTATFTSVKWGTAGAPTITSTAGKMDILTFISDGTNWYGSIAQGYTP